MLVPRNKVGGFPFQCAGENGIVLRVCRNDWRDRFGNHEKGIRLNKAANQVETICQLRVFLGAVRTLNDGKILGEEVRGD